MRKNQHVAKSSIVLVAEDLVRLALGAFLDAARCQIAGETNALEHAESLVRRLRPDAVLIDAENLPAATETTRRLTKERIAPILWLAAQTGPDRNFVIECAASAGAMGVLFLPLRPDDTDAMVRVCRARFVELEQKDEEIKTLNAQMEARKLVGRAKAVLMEQYNLSERDAFRRIQAQSAALNKPVHEIARAIITASEMGV